MICGTHETDIGRSLAEWFGRKTGKPPVPPYSAMGWTDREGYLTGVALFHDYNGANIEFHFVGKMGRHSLREAMRYPFVQLGALRLTAKPYRSNTDLIRIVEKLGFEKEGEMKNYYGLDEDAIVYRLDKAAAQKWID